MTHILPEVSDPKNLSHFGQNSAHMIKDQRCKKYAHSLTRRSSFKLVAVQDQFHSSKSGPTAPATTAPAASTTAATSAATSATVAVRTKLVVASSYC